MATIALTYNEKNALAKKKTLQAIKDAKEDKGMTTCASFEDYLKAVAE